MTKRLAIPAVLFAALAWPGVARASAPGDDVFLQAMVGTVALVCEDVPATACTNPLLNTDEDALEENGDGCVCVPDVIPGAVLRGTITLIADDDASGEVTRTMILEVVAGGETHLISESFSGPDETSLIIGLWDLGVDFEGTIFAVAWGGVRVLVAELAGVSQQLGQIAQAEFGLASTPVPVVLDPNTDLVRKNLDAPDPGATCSPGPCGKGEVDGGSSAAASVARWRATIRFANAPAP